jgi:hypothetical protein
MISFFVIMAILLKMARDHMVAANGNQLRLPRSADFRAALIMVKPAPRMEPASFRDLHRRRSFPQQHITLAPLIFHRRNNGNQRLGIRVPAAMDHLLGRSDFHHFAEIEDSDPVGNHPEYLNVGSKWGLADADTGELKDYFVYRMEFKVYGFGFFFRPCSLNRDFIYWDGTVLDVVNGDFNNHLVHYKGLNVCDDLNFKKEIYFN